MRDVVCGTWVNAWSIVRGLEACGVRAEVVGEAGGLIAPTTPEPRAGDRLYFCDERQLLRWRGVAGIEALPRSVDFAFDSKRALVALCEQLGVATVPCVEPGDVGDGRWVVKPDRSWDGDRKLPRGRLCGSKLEVRAALAELAEDGVRGAAVIIQPWIDGDGPISIGGYHEHGRPERGCYAALQRLVSSGGPTGTGAAVQLVAPLPGQLEAAQRVLDALEYTGPFELEFLARDGGVPLVLELNPRFFMQHGVFRDAGDNYLVRACRDPDALPERRVLEPGFVWLDGVHWVAALKRRPLRTARDLARLIRGQRARMSPRAVDVVRWMLQRRWERAL